MSGSVTIRRLAPGDWERFRRIRMASLRDAPDAFGSTLADAANRTEADWRAQLEALATFVAGLGDEDVGTVRGGPHDQDPSCAFLLSMWVAPGFRGHRVGEQLIEAVIDWARAERFAKLVLDVADDNRPAISLYSRMGFEPTGETGTLPPPRQHIREHRRALALSGRRL